MRKVHINRLEKLATFLETEFVYKTYKHEIKGLNHKRKFWYEWYNEGSTKKSKNCGTSGCAIGYLPILHPRIFKFDSDGSIVKINRNGYWDSSTDTAILFYGLDMDECTHLFACLEEDDYVPKLGGKILGEDATPKQVAKQIRAFIKIKTS